MRNWIRLCLLVVLLSISTATVMAEEAPIGRFADREQLIGYWELVPPHPDIANKPRHNPGLTPYQWFAFYDNGQAVSIKTDDPARRVTPRDLDNILKKSPEKVATFVFKDGFARITPRGAAGAAELWGVNVITRKVVLGKVEHLPGELIMSLDDGSGDVLYFQHLRRIALADYPAGKGGAAIKSAPLTAKDGTTITAAEREIIRTLVPFFAAINSKDTVAMKKLFRDMRATPDEQLRAMSNKEYVCHGLEDVSYDGDRLRAVAVYTFEFVNPNSISKNLAPSNTEVHLAPENGAWVIVGWYQRDAGRQDMGYFTEFFERQEKAKKRYGVADLAKWDGL